MPAFLTADDFLSKTIRAIPNPMDKCTIVSIYPRGIDEVKHTIQPGRFIIPPGSFEKPSSLVVGPSSWWKRLDDKQPLLEIPIGSPQIAESIVKDYCNGLLGANGVDEMPGIFWIPGEVGSIDLLSKYKNLLIKAHDGQMRWYRALVAMADNLWSRSQGNPLAIDDTMRLAARELGAKTKEWLADFQETEIVRCIACGAMRNPAFPICQSCHTIVDQKKWDEMNLKQTGAK